MNTNIVTPVNTLFRKESDITGITKAATYTTQIKTMNNLHGIYLYALGSGTALTASQIASDIGEISIEINGVQIRKLTGAQLVALYKFYNDQNNAITIAGQIPIMFRRTDLPLAFQNNNFALGMLKPDGKSAYTVTMKVTFLSPATLTVDTVNVFIEYDENAPQILGMHTRINSISRNHASASEQELTDLPVGKNNVAVLGYHFTSDDISSFSVLRDNIHIYNSMPRKLNDFFLHRAGRTPQTDMTHICFDLQNDAASLQPVGSNAVSNWIIKPTWSAAPSNYTIIPIEVHVSLEG